MSRSMKPIESVDSVGWTKAIRFTTVDGHEVTHYGLDRNMNFYYRTIQGIYIKPSEASGWIRICAPSQFL